MKDNLKVVENEIFEILKDYSDLIISLLKQDNISILKVSYLEKYLNALLKKIRVSTLIQLSDML